MPVTFRDLEEEKARLLERLSEWPQSTLRQQPAPGSWSAAQIVEHLMKTERDILVEVRKGIQKGGHSRSIRDRFGVAMIDRVFRSPRKVKVPKSVTSVLPGDTVDVEQVLESWSRERQALAAVLADAPEHAAQRGLWRHPVGGWMNLPQTLNFFSSHIVHHHFQLNAIEAAHAQRPAATG